jgi:hypothetical protein
MKIRWKGVLAIEGEQTGDGRLIAADALTWADLPMPLGFLENQQHGDMSEGGPTVGTIEGIERQGTDIVSWGYLDDEIPEAAEIVRRMQAGTAPHGDAWYVSIDPDDAEVELLVKPTPVEEGDEDGEDVLMLLASAHQPAGASLRTTMAEWQVRAAAGDGIDDAEYEVLFQDAVDALVERYTRLRIRGATLCAVPAFADAMIRLDTEPADEQLPAEPVEDPASEQVTAAVPEPEPLPAEWFTDPCLPCPTPLTITREGRVLGHVAAWGTCHKGYADRCVPPPRGTDYSDFHQGRVDTTDGEVRTGVFAWGIPHADLTLDILASYDHYADSRFGWADVVVGEDEHGIWYSGALRPGLTADDVRVLRSLAISGDWRYSASTGVLELIAGLAVNFPGFPIPDAAGVPVVAAAQASVPVGGGLVALVAAGVVPQPEPHGCGCDDDERLDQVLALVRKLDLRTRHLTAAAADALRASITRG